MKTKRKQYIFRINTDNQKVIRDFIKAYKKALVEEIIIIPADVIVKVKRKKLI